MLKEKKITVVHRIKINKAIDSNQFRVIDF